MSIAFDKIVKNFEQLFHYSISNSRHLLATTLLPLYITKLIPVDQKRRRNMVQNYRPKTNLPIFANEEGRNGEGGGKVNYRYVEISPLQVADPS